MANLRGVLRGNRGSTSRTAHDVLEAELSTWKRKVTVFLDKEGGARIVVEPIGEDQVSGVNYASFYISKQDVTPLVYRADGVSGADSFM